MFDELPKSVLVMVNGTTVSQYVLEIMYIARKHSNQMRAIPGDYPT